METCYHLPYCFYIYVNITFFCIFFSFFSDFLYFHIFIKLFCIKGYRHYFKDITTTHSTWVVYGPRTYELTSYIVELICFHTIIYYSSIFNNSFKFFISFTLLTLSLFFLFSHIASIPIERHGKTSFST